MDNLQTASKLSQVARYSPALLPFLLIANANAADIDTSSVTTAITGLGTGVAAIGGAILLILVAIKGYSLIKRAL